MRFWPRSHLPQTRRDSASRPVPHAAARAGRAAPPAAWPPSGSRWSRGRGGARVRVLRIRPRGAQHLDDAVRHAAAAVHGDAGGLVEHQQVGVLVHDRVVEQLLQRRARRARRPAASPASGRRTGGTRMRSPAARRWSGLARLLFTRTSPLRSRRYTWVRGTPFRVRTRKLSSRCPASPSPASTYWTAVGRVAPDSSTSAPLVLVSH